MSMVPKCVECDEYYHKPHHPDCSFGQPAPPPLGPDRKCEDCGGMFSPVMFQHPDINFCVRCCAAEETV